MRINSSGAANTHTQPAAIKRTTDFSGDRAVAQTTTSSDAAPQTSAAPASKAKAHGVIRKLGTGHFRDSVELKLTARFAPERLVPPVEDPVTEPASDPSLDPAPDPHVIPGDETSSDPAAQENELTAASVTGDAPLTRDALLTRNYTTDAFANFNLVDFTQSPTIDLIA